MINISFQFSWSWSIIDRKVIRESGYAPKIPIVREYKPLRMAPHLLFIHYGGCMPIYTKYIFFLILGLMVLGGCDDQVRFRSILSDGLSARCAKCATKDVGLQPINNKSQSADEKGGEFTPPAHSVILSPFVNAVAFEDLYSKNEFPKNQPDFDYNDFLTDFKIQEFMNGKKDLTDIVIDFYPRAVGAGFDHIFYLILTGLKTTPSKNRNSLPISKPMFVGPAHVTVTYFDAHGEQVGPPVATPFDQDIVVYPSTHAIFASADHLVVPNAFDLSSSFPTLNTTVGANGDAISAYRASNRNARVYITLDRPELNPYLGEGFDPATFRVILHPIKTNYDIDIINVDPANFVGSSGYPWGFIIPTDWQWMKEGVQIDMAYPEFKEYRKFLMGKAAAGDYMNWYKYPAGQSVEKPPGLLSRSPAETPMLLLEHFDALYLYPSIPLRETMPSI
jgi:Domain of unknown function (DUF4842)